MLPDIKASIETKYSFLFGVKTNHLKEKLTKYTENVLEVEVKL